ncbi:MAG: hypothetical protein WDN75_14200 [Bacteroidota bacterium]
MKNRVKNSGQLVGTFFAFLIMLFSIGNSYGEPQARLLTDSDFSYSEASTNHFTPQEGPDHRDNPFANVHLLSSAAAFVKSDPVMAAPEISKALLVNGHARNAIYSLPCIHAP